MHGSVCRYFCLCPERGLTGPKLTLHCNLWCYQQDYKDDNHKPEMALALDGFEALCGFVSHEELKQALQSQPELRLCVGEEAASKFLEASGEALKPVRFG